MIYIKVVGEGSHTIQWYSYWYIILAEVNKIATLVKGSFNLQRGHNEFTAGLELRKKAFVAEGGREKKEQEE